MTPRLVGVFAHPDDDTYGIGGTSALHADDIDLTVVLATSGDAGRIADESLATHRTLAVVREQEDRASWAEIGIEPTLHFLRHPDSGLASVPRERLIAEVTDVLVESRPHVVVTFGPEGVTGHDDHIAIGEVATEAFHLARDHSDGPGFERLLYVALRRSRLDRLDTWLRAHGMDPLDPNEPFAPRGVRDETVAALVDCLPVYRRKLEALRQHRTQGELEDIPAELYPEVIGEEAFVQGWPERVPGSPVLSDVFEGLDLS